MLGTDCMNSIFSISPSQDKLTALTHYLIVYHRVLHSPTTSFYLALSLIIPSTFFLSLVRVALPSFATLLAQGRSDSLYCNYLYCYVFMVSNKHLSKVNPLCTKFQFWILIERERERERDRHVKSWGQKNVQARESNL